MRARTSSFKSIVSLFVVAVLVSSCSTNIADSDNVLSENVGFEKAEEATAGFDVESDIYSAADGSITIEYLGEEVEIDYKDTWTTLDVAATLCQAVKVDNDIQILCNHSYSSSPTSVTVRERRTGSQYNSNPVYISDSNSTNHIKLSDSVIYLSGGTD